MLRSEKETGVESLISAEQNKKEQNKSEPEKKNKRGRPKGSKNKNKENVDLPPHLIFIQNMLKKTQQLIGSDILLVYAVLDGVFGNNNALQMVRQCGMHLISKLQHNSALYFPYEGAYSGSGPRKKYGDRINYKNIPDKYLN